MLNKPRGLVTTARDERGRKTVYDCLEGAQVPFISPVGRLDQASEGLLLFTNDTVWSAGITDDNRSIRKTYHVHVDVRPDDSLCASLMQGVDSDVGPLAAHKASVLRVGIKNGWIEIELCEGRNRHIRRLLAAHGINTLRLVRIAIGDLFLGSLAKGAFRFLEESEVSSLRTQP